MPKIPIAVAFFSAIFVVAAVMTLVAFLPTYEAGLDDVESTIDTLRIATVGKMASEVGAFFAKPIEVFTVIAISERIGSPLLGSLPFAARARFVCSWRQKMQGVADQIEFHAYDHPTEYRTACSTTFLARVFPNSNIEVYNFNYTDDAPVGPWYSGPGGLQPPSVYKTISQALPLPELYVPTWGAPEPGLSETRFWLGMKTLDEFGNFSELSTQIKPKEVTNLLINVGLRPRARAFVAHKLSYRIVGTSWNETTFTPLAGFGNISYPPPERMVLKNASGLSDALVLETIAALGGEAAFHALPAPYQTTFSGKSGKVFVDIVDITDANGLGLRVLLTMPLKDFTEEIDQTRGVTIGTVCGVLVLMLGVSVVFAMVLAKPLQSLGHRMHLTASLQDTLDDDSLSALKEVADMQQAYNLMKAELQRMKKFLPQSLMHVDPLDTSQGSTMSNPMDSAPMTEAHGSTTSLSLGASINVMEHFAAQGVDAGRLRAENNIFTGKDCVAVVVSIAYQAEIGTAEHTAALEAVLDAVVRLAAKHRGVIEQLKPQQAILTFGARRRVTNPAVCALKFALSLTKFVIEPEVEVNVLLDRGTYFVGSCGTDDLRQESVQSPELDLLTSMAPLLHSKHRIPVVAAGRIAPSLTERCVVFPFDVLQLADRSPMQVFTVVGMGAGALNACNKRLLLHIKRGFGLMCSGAHNEARSELVEAQELLSSPAAKSMSESVEFDVFQATVARVLAAMISTVMPLQDTKQPYARRYLGWPTTDGPSPLAPVFDTNRCVVAESDKAPQRLAAQLDELTRIRDSRMPTFGKKSSSAEGGDARASGLFEMAFTRDTVDDEMTISSAATSTRTTFAAEVVDHAPSSEHYLRHWRRGETPLGKGAFGAVYRALHDNGSLAAMKILPLTAATTDLDELRKELVVSAGQRHENLVSFVDADVGAEELVVIMELLPGGSLEALSNDFGRLPSRVVRRFVVDILRGLAHLHRAGIVHCDVKPQNVLVGVDGVAKVADFGSALHPGFDTKFGSSDTGDLKVPGTPAYMAPEVARGGAPTPASDIWSFGLMVHELLGNGARPFNREQQKQMASGAFKCISTMGGIKEDGTALREPPRVALPPGTEDVAAIEAFLSTCLAVDPEKRPSCERLLTMEYLL